jgi:hypothetical protein
MAIKCVQLKRGISDSQLVARQVRLGIKINPAVSSWRHLEAEKFGNT